MPDPDDHLQIPSVVPPYSFSGFPYDALDKGERVGTGGDADIYRATIDRNGESYTVAIKEPRFDGTLDKRVLDRFQKEAETWAKIDDHNNIVTVYSWSATPIPWLALEYMDGGTLASKVGSSDIKQALWLSSQVAEGIRYGHRHGVAHLDLKPSNILLRETDATQWSYPKVSDWGLAKLLLDHSKSMEGISPTYAAPEQFDAERFGAPDDITDIYQLGTVMYTLIAGEPPFSGSATSVMQRVLNDKPEPLSTVNPQAPSAVDEILQKALAKHKSERYQGVLPLLQDINQLFERYITEEAAHSGEISSSNAIDSVQSSSQGSTDSAPPTSQTEPTTDSQDRTDNSSLEAGQWRLTRRAALGVLATGAVGAGVFAVNDFRRGQSSSPSMTRDVGEVDAATTVTERATETVTYGNVEQDWAIGLSADTGAVVEAWPFRDSVLIGRYNYDGPHQFMRFSKDGTRIWSHSNLPESHSIYKSSVATGDGYIVLGMPRESRYTFDPPNDGSDLFRGGLLHCYDAESGELVWQHETSQDTEEFFITSVNISDNGIVTATVDGRGATGNQTSTASVYGLDLQSGAKQWRHKSFDDTTVERVADTVLYDGNCFTSGFFGGYLIDIETGDLSSQAPEPRYPYFDISVENNYIYGTDSSFGVKFDMASLSSKWETELSAGAGRNCIIGSDSVFMDDRDGYVYSLNKVTGRENWRQRVQGTTVSMALTSRYLWVSDTNRGVRAYDPATGERIFNPVTFATETAAAAEQIPIVGWSDSVFIGGSPSGRYTLQV